MSLQTGFFGPSVESEPEQSVRREKGDVSRRSLPRSILDCYRVEDEVWRRLRGADCSEQSDAETIRAALLSEYTNPPPWCELAAWQRICRSFRDWARTFGNLELFVDLRRRRDE